MMKSQGFTIQRIVDVVNLITVASSNFSMNKVATANIALMFLVELRL